MPSRPHLAINMVATVDGRAALGGTATGIGSALDRQHMRQLRADFDVVLHGAGTVRADPLSARVPAHLAEQRAARGQSPQPLGAIITASGNLPFEHPYYQSPTVVYITSDRPVSVPDSVQVVRVADIPAATTTLVVSRIDIADQRTREEVIVHNLGTNRPAFAKPIVEQVPVELVRRRIRPRRVVERHFHNLTAAR